MTTHGLRRICCACLLLPGLALAAPGAPAPAPASTGTPPLHGDTISVEVTGHAKTRDEAIATALAQAVIKVQGKEVPFSVLSRMFLGSLREERMMRMNVLNDTRIRATRISTAVAFVQDYQVTASQRDEDDGNWQATVSADVVSPQARLAHRRAVLPLALPPFVFMQEEESEAGGTAAQAAMKQTLRDLATFRHNVETNLKRQERITLHPLTDTQDVQLEKAADLPGQTDWQGLASASGATHFITVQVEDFRTEAVKLKGNITTARLDGGFTFHYRLIRTDKGQAEIMKSGTFTLDTRSPYLHAMAMSESNAPANPTDIRRRINALQGRVAELFAQALASDLILPQVLARQGDSLLLQAGATQLRRGDQLAVLGPDIATPDSTTGLTLREDGARIAVLEVTATTPERIVAQVVKGNAFAVQPGSLLRRIGAGSSGVAAAAIPASGSAPAAPTSTP